MATTDKSTKPKSRGFQLSPVILVGVAAVLAPLGYLAGRVSTGALQDTAYEFVASGLATGALGMMIGIPIGLFFGSLRHGGRSIGAGPNQANTQEMESSILEQIRRELAENQALFEARKGSTTMFARIDYITPFWTSIKASGRLFVMQDAMLLNVIGTAYYWLDQATHLEKLAYEAKYAPAAEGEHATAERLISEARLLDGQIENSLSAAVSAIDGALSSR